jgi:hypothetical protein
VFVKEKGRPHSYGETGAHKRSAGNGCRGGTEIRQAKENIDSPPKESESESHGYDSDVVKNAF